MNFYARVRIFFYFWGVPDREVLISRVMTTVAVSVLVLLLLAVGRLPGGHRVLRVLVLVMIGMNGAGLLSGDDLVAVLASLASFPLWVVASGICLIVPAVGREAVCPPAPPQVGAADGRRTGTDPGGRRAGRRVTWVVALLFAEFLKLCVAALAFSASATSSVIISEWTLVGVSLGLELALLLAIRWLPGSRRALRRLLGTLIAFNLVGLPLGVDPVALAVYGSPLVIFLSGLCLTAPGAAGRRGPDLAVAGGVTR